jgi:single-strand DNA-binding protein
VKNISDDLKLASFTVACDDDYKDGDGNRNTEFIDCKAWRNEAKFVEDYISKGRLVCVVGRLKTESWEDPKYTDTEGNVLTRRKTVLVVDKVYPLDSKKENSGEEESQPQERGQRNQGKQTNNQSQTQTQNQNRSKLPNW